MEVAVSVGTKPPPASPPAARRAAPAGGFGHRGPDLLPLDAGEQYRFGFDMGACIGCHSCEVACAEQNGLPDGTTWRRVGEVEAGAHPDTRRFHLSMSCNHCLDPACLTGCPTDAYVKLDSGIVDHHADDCVGCGYCTWTCPYSVPAIQPDRRVVTKCDMCRPRLDDGFAPACVTACPTHAITVEKVDVAAWRADHRAGDAPHLPDAGLTVSTTRIALPDGLAVGDATVAADDWDLRPESAHWPLVWLTLVSQAALGVSTAAAAGGSGGTRGAAAASAFAGLVGALFHLGRPAAAWKAMRNLRTSWLSREVAALSLYALLAAVAVLVPALAWPAALAGVAGVFASARLYLVPGRPAWDSRLTIARFFATAAVLGPAALGFDGLSRPTAPSPLYRCRARWSARSRSPPQTDPDSRCAPSCSLADTARPMPSSSTPARLPTSPTRSRARPFDAAAAFELFFTWLGRMAGDLALIVGATGGVYVAGGIVPKYLEPLTQGPFRAAFEGIRNYSLAATYGVLILSILLMAAMAYYLVQTDRATRALHR